jgi:uncharacterized protein (DUF1800 family)
MSSLVRSPRSSSAAVALLWILTGCIPGHRRVNAPSPRGGDLPESERVAHVLSRLTFGARPGDAERVASMGVNRWIEEQLHPERIDDSIAVAALKPLAAWSQPTSEAAQVLTGDSKVLSAVAARPLPTTAAGRDSLAVLLKTVRIVINPNDQFFAGKIVRAQVSERQLEEVVADFWENHFSVFTGKMPGREALIVWDRDVLRPHALGKFRELLGAVAHSPAMLFYLDNQLSRRGALNENYARELMELHTLGVDGGYTQQDVIEVARALTGWTIDQARTPRTFVFRPANHDTGPKTVLGHMLAGGRGIEDGEEVLDIVARHPSTARFISFKLARRLVSDEPPASLVDRAAATFTRTDGDIREVVRTIVTSPEFFSRAAFRSKVKTPFELVVSVRRAFEAPADTTPATARQLAQLGQPMFGVQTPDGWPDKATAWVNSGTIFQRIKLGADASNNRPPFSRVEKWRGWADLSTAPAERQADGVIRLLLGGVADTTLRQALLAAGDGSPAGNDIAAGSRRLREMLSIALGSPEFQRR